jgi:hypothetical protein
MNSEFSTSSRRDLRGMGVIHVRLRMISSLLDGRGGAADRDMIIVTMSSTKSRGTMLSLLVALNGVYGVKHGG